MHFLCSSSNYELACLGRSHTKNVHARSHLAAVIAKQPSDYTLILDSITHLPATRHVVSPCVTIITKSNVIQVSQLTNPNVT